MRLLRSWAGRRRRCAGVSASASASVTVMKDRPAIAGIDLGCWRFSLFGCRNQLPLAECSPGVISFYAVHDGYITLGHPAFLRFIHNAIVQRHGPGRGFVSACIVEIAIVKNGDWEDPGGDNASGIRGDFKHGGCAESMRFSALCVAGDSKGKNQQGQNYWAKAGQELFSAI